MQTIFHRIRACIKVLKRHKQILKLAIAVVLLALLFWRGKIDFDPIARLAQMPEFWIVCIAGNVLISALAVLRWKIIISRLTTRNLPLIRLFGYSWASVFVGLAFLGTVGTDAYRISVLQSIERIPVRVATRTVFSDRVVSLFGLILISLAVAICLYFSSARIDFLLPPLLLISLAYPTLFLTLCSNVLKAFLGVAIFVLQTGSTVELSETFNQIMLGLTVEAIPISWQGIGTGHYGFSYFLGDVGPTVFTAYLCGRTVFKLLGICFFFPQKPQIQRTAFPQ